MDNYKDLFIDIDKFDEDNISYVKPILFYKVTRNMGIYYRKEIINKFKSETKTTDKKKSKKKTESDSFVIKKQTKKQKIIIQTPKMVVPFGVKEFDNNGKKSYQMSLSFSTLTNLYNEEEIKKFYLFIQKIDSVNEETIMDYKKDWGLPKNIKYRKTLQRLSAEYPHHMNITLPYDDKMGFLFHVYDEQAKKSSIDIIEKKSIVSVVMELTDLKFTDTEFRSNWTVMQIRKFKPYSPIQEFFMSGCFICDEDDPEDTAYAQLIEKYNKTLTTPIALPRIPQINPNYYNINPYQMPYMQNPYGQIPNMAHPMPQIAPPPPPQNKPINQDPLSQAFKPPSLQELLTAKKALKKTKTVVKGTLQNTNNEEGNKYDNEDNNENTNIPPPPNAPPPPLKKESISNKKSPNKNNSDDKKKTNSDDKKKTNSDDKKKTNSDDKKKISTVTKKMTTSKKSVNESDSDSESADDLPKNKKKIIPKKTTLESDNEYESPTNKKKIINDKKQKSIPIKSGSKTTKKPSMQSANKKVIKKITIEK
ncbi:putative orfan [Tupanvirus soda lake]|uniref:Orfan n=2 Tax=Tupanvirus TaxID=2094720 RepID=A0AC62AB57_9VIRU|nr:putative orfan [Tupanvirus soda lake]QKU35015.1 putative orfan [Tupanvirus soda lake]